MAGSLGTFDFARRMVLADKFRLDLAVEKASGEIDFLIRCSDPTRNGTWRIFRIISASTSVSSISAP